jgi:FAD reductase [NAD(P)H]
VCKLLEEKARAAGLYIVYIDLRDIDLEFCDGRDFGDYNETIQKAYRDLEPVEAVIFGMPVYQYSMSGVLKNFIDICGGAIEGNAV